MSEIIVDTRFECAECREWWEDADDAIECCPASPRQFTVYICSECYVEHLDTLAAKACCGEGADE